MLFFLLFSASYAESTASPGLNSEGIRERYGNYGVEVLAASESQRLSSLYSIESVAADKPQPQRTTRTLAIVRFQLPLLPALDALHQQIVNGASIGETFRDARWFITKELIQLCELTVESGDLPGIDSMHLSLPANLALHRYRFTVQKAGVKSHYAVIEEIHHPDYLDLAALQRLYLPVTAFPVATHKLTACSISL